MKEITRIITVRIATRRALADENEPMTKRECKALIEEDLTKMFDVDEVTVLSIDDMIREKGGTEYGVIEKRYCNDCEFLSINEEDQNRIKELGGVCLPHICEKYNKRVLHYPYTEPYIHPCEECEKGGNNNE